MKDFKLKLILSILSAIVFSLLVILLAFVLPIEKNDTIHLPKSILEKVSHSAKQ